LIKTNLFCLRLLPGFPAPVPETVGSFVFSSGGVKISPELPLSLRFDCLLCERDFSFWNRGCASFWFVVGVDVLHLTLKAAVRPLGKREARVSCLLPESCVFDFQTCCGCCSGTSGYQGSPTRAGGERLDGSSMAVSRAEDDNQPHGEAGRAVLPSLQSTGSVWKTIVSLAEHPTARRRWASLPDAKAWAR